METFQEAVAKEAAKGRSPVTDLVVGDVFSIPNSRDVVNRKVVAIEEETHVRVITVDGPAIKHASREDNTVRLRRHGQFVEIAR